MMSDAVSCFPEAMSPEPAEISASGRAMAKSSTEPVLQTCEISDELLLTRVGTGEREALSLLFHRHARAVFSVARRILQDETEAEDLVQDLFLFLFQKANLYDETRSSGASWIIQMAYHRAIDRRRYLGVRHHYTAEEIHEGQLPAVNGRSATNEITGRALLEKLRGELSAEQRQTLEMHLFEGYTFHEIAQRTGQTFGNVRNHYYRSLERLRSHVFPKK